jgi:hypothetical protein
MKMRRRSFQIAVLAAAVSLWAGCGGSDDGAAPLLMSVDASGSSSIDAQALSAELATYAKEVPLSDAEMASLAYMREEEQLAHDVYAVSTTLYAQPIFANIATSEATHSAAVKTLLDRYQQADPLEGLPNGSFKTPAFQALYDALAAKSRLGLVEALKVGVEIEELDIHDVMEQMAVVDNADILMVYDHLTRASRNHLRSFMKELTQQGGSYVPQYISQSLFNAIVDSPMETGP